MKFKAYNPFIKQMRTDRGFRIELDVSQDEYDNIKDLPKLQDKVLDINIDINLEVGLEKDLKEIEKNEL